MNACVYPVILEPLVEKMVFSQLNGLGTLIESQLSIDIWVFFLGSEFCYIHLYVASYTSTTLPSCGEVSFKLTYFVVSLKIGKCESFNFIRLF